MKNFFKISCGLLLVAFFIEGCKNNNVKETAQYTCPMPKDSFFSDKPGKCPKCGMELQLLKSDSVAAKQADAGEAGGYSCPMHPQIHSKVAGNCSICGMQLEKTKSPLEPKAVSLNTLLRPANQQVIANIPMIHLIERKEDIQMESFGFIAYDTRHAAAIAANFSGRIEKLYVRYRYQHINKGQRIMDIYSPELQTAEENLLFILKNDRGNTTLLGLARQKLMLLGMNDQQIKAVVQSGKPSGAVVVYSNYSGHVHESNEAGMNQVVSKTMEQTQNITAVLSLKEGMYVQKGQTVFEVLDPARAWVLINVFEGEAAMLKAGNKVQIFPEADSSKNFYASINFIEPVYRPGSKTLTARVYFNNANYKLPIGSQVKASIYAGYRSADWLPEEAVLSLGLEKMVFVRHEESFLARKIATGISNKHLVQVLSGLDKTDAVAANAQYLVDSESFIKSN
jgi:Cu(I)/Ag(I) efflux system membrane fusion protein